MAALRAFFSRGLSGPWRISFVGYVLVAATFALREFQFQLPTWTGDIVAVVASTLVAIAAFGLLLALAARLLFSRRSSVNPWLTIATFALIGFCTAFVRGAVGSFMGEPNHPDVPLQLLMTTIFLVTALSVVAGLVNLVRSHQALTQTLRQEQRRIDEARSLTSAALLSLNATLKSAVFSKAGPVLADLIETANQLMNNATVIVADLHAFAAQLRNATEVFGETGRTLRNWKHQPMDRPATSVSQEQNRVASTPTVTATIDSSFVNGSVRVLPVALTTTVVAWLSSTQPVYSIVAIALSFPIYLVCLWLLSKCLPTSLWRAPLSLRIVVVLAVYVLAAPPTLLSVPIELKLTGGVVRGPLGEIAAPEDYSYL